MTVGTNRDDDREREREREEDEEEEEEEELIHESESNLIHRAVVPRRRVVAAAAGGGGKGHGARESAFEDDDDDDAAGVRVAIKSLARPSDPTDLSCLHNEYNVLTRHLAGCPPARRALFRDVGGGGGGGGRGGGGGPALYLEWAEGGTLQEWMDANDPPPLPPAPSHRPQAAARPPTKKFPPPPQQQGRECDDDDDDGCVGADAWRDDLLLRIRIARELAAALAQVHDAGVVHNDIFADNVVVSFDGDEDEDEDGPGGDVGDGGAEDDDRAVVVDPTDEDEEEKKMMMMKKKKKEPKKVSIKIIDFGFAALSAGIDLTDYDMNAGCDGEDDEEGANCNDDIYALGNVLRDLFLGKDGRIEMRHDHAGAAAAAGRRESAGRNDSDDGGCDADDGQMGMGVGTGADPHPLRTREDLRQLGGTLRSSTRSSLASTSRSRLSASIVSTTLEDDRLSHSRKTGRRWSSFILTDDLGVPTYHEGSYHEGSVDVDGSDRDSDREDDRDGDAPGATKRQQQLQQQRCVPQSVIDLVSNLMVTTGGAGGGFGEPTASTVALDPYRSAHELEEDLTQMLDDPDTFLFDRDEGLPPPEQIELKEGRLYGKEREIEILFDSYGRIVEGGKSECVFVYGSAGAGKSTLMRQLRWPVVERGGYYVSGKFDQLRGDEPYSALIAAFSEFCDVILSKDPSVVEEIGQAIEEAIGTQGMVLAEMIPELEDVIDAARGGADGFVHDVNGRGQEKVRLEASDGYEQTTAPLMTASAITEASNGVGRLGEKGGIKNNSPSAAPNPGPEPRPPIKRRRSSTDFSQNRLHRAFRMFTRAISSPDHPVVLALDDLQWADAASIELVRSLVTDPDNASLLFVGSYRDDEVPGDHPLRDFLWEMKQREEGGGDVDGVGVKRVSVGDLNLDSANLLVSESLRLTRRITRPLTEIIHRKTHGNVLFFLQFLRSFCDEGLLYYSLDLGRWKWDADRMRTRNPSDNVAGLLADKIRGLPGEAREVVQLAAGLGSYFDGGMLRRLVADFRRESSCADDDGDGDGEGDGDGGNRCSGSWSGSVPDDDSGLKRVFRYLVSEGMIDRVPEQGSLRYKFSHDRIQQAAYSLVPEEERGRLHLRIGHLLLRHTSTSASALASASASASISSRTAERFLFAAVDQLNRGSAHLGTETERIQVAVMNLRAGERAIQSSAFGPAASYLRRGVGLLGESMTRHWRDHYELSLRLFQNLAEAEYCNCRFDRVEAIAGEVLERAASLDDAFPAYLSLIKSRGARGNSIEASRLGFDVLKRLGEPFPRRPGKFAVVADMVRTKLMLRGKTDDDLEKLPAMRDPAKIAAMKVLTNMFSYAHFVKPEYAFLVAMRMVQITLRHGACDESAFGFVSYGCLLCGFMNETKAGYRFGQLALSLVRRFDAREWIARVYALVYSTTVHWRRGLQLTLDPLLYACRMGLEAGDNEYAMYSAMDYCVHSFYCGRPLASLEEEVKEYCRQMVEHGQDNAHALTLPYWQTILNLMGRSDDPMKLLGDAMDQNQLMEECQEKGLSTAVAVINVNRVYLAYTFGNYTLAQEIAEKCRNIVLQTGGMFIVNSEVFYHGLLCFALAREAERKHWTKNGRKHWTKKGRKTVKKMKKWAQLSQENCLHRAYLLEAEHAAVVGKCDKAAGLYDRAITTANNCGFIQDEALAYERGGVHFKSVNNDHMASRYFARAQELYLVWGAEAKAELLRTQYRALVAPARRRHSFQAFKKRRCSGRLTAHVSPNGMR